MKFTHIFQWPCGCTIWTVQSNHGSAGRSHVSAWPCETHAAIPQSSLDWAWLQSGARDENEVMCYLGLSRAQAEVKIDPIILTPIADG